MTHDELLASVARLEDYGKAGYTPAAFAALRAVVEMHKPNLLSGTLTLVCIECHSVKDCSTCNATNNAHDWHYALYPCPTIQAIEKELG